VPVLMLSSHDDIDARVNALSLGADDYLGKPFSPRELVARVKALLRRAGDESGGGDVRTFAGGRLEIDEIRHEVRVDGRAADLTRTEYDLLLALAKHPGRAYSREELALRVRGHDFAGYERTFDAHIKNLRRKIEDDPTNPSWVRTVRGVGYRLDAEVG
jgi:DNA-binding response OmpR family regulator